MTDMKRVDPVESTRGTGSVYPTHSFIIFDRTEQDGYLRVELVALVVDGRPQGLAVAITDYTNTPGKWVDQGQPGWPIPSDTVRRTRVLERRSSLVSWSLLPL